MAYPTLKSLHGKLLCEGALEELSDIIAHTQPYDMLKMLSNIEHDMQPGYITDILKEKVAKLSKGDYTAADVTKELSKQFTEQHVDIAMFFLQGELYPTKGFNGVTNEVAKILDSVKVPRRIEFIEYLKEHIGTDIWKIARAYYYNVSHRLESLRYDFGKALMYDINLTRSAHAVRKAYEEFKQVTVKELDENQKSAIALLNRLFKLIETYPQYKPLQLLENVGISSSIYEVMEEASNLPAEKDRIFNEFVTSNPYFIDDSQYILGNAARVTRELENHILTKEMETDDAYKYLVGNLRRLVKPLRNIDRDKFGEIFAPIDAISTEDAYSLVSEIGKVTKENADDPTGAFISKSSIGLIRDYKLFKKLPIDIQNSYISLMMQLAKEWNEKYGESDEALRRKIPPEAPSSDLDAIFDDYAFADQRIDIPYEKNNEEEEKIYALLLSHFRSNKPIPVDVAEQFKHILAKGHYSSIFKAPRPGPIFRGMKVTRDWIEKALGTATFPNIGDREAKFNYTPRENHGISSWSINVEYARMFAGNPKTEEYSVVIVAEAEDNPLEFVSGPGGLYKVPGFDRYDDEQEAIGLSKIKASHLFWSKSVGIKQKQLKRYGAYTAAGATISSDDLAGYDVELKT